MSNRKEIDDLINNLKCEEDEVKFCLHCKKQFTPVNFKAEHKHDLYCTFNCQKMHFRKNNKISYLRSIGIPKKCLQSSLAHFKSDFTHLVNDKDMKNIFISSKKTGVGKTYLASALLIYYGLNFPKECKFVNSTKLLMEIRSSYNNPEIKESEIIRKYSTYDLLVIDDLGAEKISEYVISIFYIILNDRDYEMLPTIITTNLDPDEIKGKYDQRIISRAMSGHCFKLSGEDRRISQNTSHN